MDFLKLQKSALKLFVAVNLRFPLFLIKEAVVYFGRTARIVNMPSIYARSESRRRPALFSMQRNSGICNTVARPRARPEVQCYSQLPQSRPC